MQVYLMSPLTLMNAQIRDNQFTPETLELTSKLLKGNPEYYTIWNHRRLILRHQFDHAGFFDLKESTSSDYEALVSLISDDLAFLIPLLRKFPKCYWIWNYRLWLLEEVNRLLPPPVAQKFWQQELTLAGKMLNLDSRNFHGWGYRRTVTRALEGKKFQSEDLTTSMTREEFDYTTKMINSNLSNFSAWHSRSKLIPKLLDETSADHGTRINFLDDGNKNSDLSPNLMTDGFARARVDRESAVGRFRRPVAVVLPPVPDVFVRSEICCDSNGARTYRSREKGICQQRNHQGSRDA